MPEGNQTPSEPTEQNHSTARLHVIPTQRRCRILLFQKTDMKPIARQVLKSERNNPQPKPKKRTQDCTASGLERLLTKRLALEPSSLSKFLCLLLVALTLFPLLSVSRVDHYLAGFALFISAHEPRVVRQGMSALTRLLVLAEACPAGPSGATFWAT